MTDEIVKEEVVSPETENENSDSDGSVSKELAPEFDSVEDALSEIAKLRGLNTEFKETRDSAKAKLRTFEEAEEKTRHKKLKADGKLEELLEEERSKRVKLEERFTKQTVDTALTSALKDAKVNSISTALKLVDRSKVLFDDNGSVNIDSLADAVTALKDSDAILFAETTSIEKPKGPAVKRAGEGETKDAFETEMRSCKTQFEVNEVLRKFGKL